MKKNFLYTIGVASLITFIVIALSTVFNALCIWLGYLGLIISLVVVVFFLLSVWDNLASATQESYATCTVFLSVFYMLSVILYAWFIPAAISIGILCGMMWYLKSIDVDIFALCVTSYVLGVEFSFILMGDEVPAGEMKLEYLAVAAVVITWLQVCIDSIRYEKPS